MEQHIEWKAVADKRAIKITEMQEQLEVVQQQMAQINTAILNKAKANDVEITTVKDLIEFVQTLYVPEEQRDDSI